jgi:HK97 family phage major capsid protein
VNRTSRKGVATDLTYILCVNGRRIVIGRVAGIELAVSEHAYFGADQVALRVITRLDIGVSRPESIVVCPTLKVA